MARPDFTTSSTHSSSLFVIPNNFIDFHNQRLHAVIAKPYDANVDKEKDRLHKAIAIADLIMESVQQKREVDGDAAIEAADIRIGIDSGIAAAVNNGGRRNGER